jgi:hypothetical protein
MSAARRTTSVTDIAEIVADVVPGCRVEIAQMQVRPAPYRVTAKIAALPPLAQMGCPPRAGSFTVSALGPHPVSSGGAYNISHIRSDRTAHRGDLDPQAVASSSETKAAGRIFTETKPEAVIIDTSGGRTNRVSLRCSASRFQAA